jgi:hypothetical protein
MRLSSSWEAAAHTHLTARQDSRKTVPNSRRCNQQSDPESNFGQVQTHKAPPEALTIFTSQQGTMTNGREKYLLQDQTTKVTPEALNFFLNRSVTMWNYAVQRRVQQHNKEITPEAMPNYLSITIHLKLSPSSRATIPRFSSVAADIIK